MIGSLVIRNIEKEDLLEIAKVHLESFPDSALSQLGVGAVHRYYLWQLEGPHQAEAICAVTAGEIVGFCFGGIFRGAMGGYLRHNKNYLVWCVLSHPWVLWSPVVRKQVGTALQVLRPERSKERKRSQKDSICPPSIRKRFSILSIAVSPGYQKRGIGRLIMDEMERRARNDNFAEMRLTVHRENAKAISFYESLGWEKFRGLPWTGRMKKDLQ